MKQWLVILSVWLAAGSVPLWGQERLDSLSTYLEAAEQGNPGLRSAYILYKAARQEIPQAGGLQDPKLDLGIFTPPMALVGGKEAAQFQLMQMFPWPGVLGARRSAAAHRAKAAYEQYRQARDLLRAEVQAQWFALCRLHQEEKYNREDTFLLSELETLALRRYEAPEEGSGMSQGSMADVLRIRMEINEAANTLLDLSEQMSAAKAKFNALLGRPGDSPLTVADTLRQIPLPFDPASAAGTLRAQNPSLRAINEEGASLKAKARADKRGAYPSFGIGLQYMLVNSALSGGMNMHGKDMFMPMLSLTLPLYRNKYKAQQREDALRLEASRQQYADMAEQLAAAISRLRSEAAQAAARIELCRRQTELARSLYRLRVQEFASGSSPLDEALQAARLLLSYQVKTADAVASYNTANANIQKLLSSNEGIDF